VLELTTSVERGSEVQESARSSPLVIIMEGSPETSYQIGGELASAPAAADVHHGLRPFVTGLAAPMAIAPLPDGRILIGERAGTVKIAGVGDNAPTVALESADLQDFDGDRRAAGGGPIGGRVRAGA
jgi:glucose/arabinose dehydrogenase